MLLVVMGGCRTRAPADEAYAFGGPAVLPSVGLSAGTGAVFRRSETANWAVEAEYVYQFLDDKDFLDDGRPSAGDVHQVRAGFRRFSNPGRRRSFAWGGGFVFLQAAGGAKAEPLILEPAGDYYGVYGQVGFLTRLSPRWSVGPEFRLLVVGGHGVQVVPQFMWQFVMRY